MNTREPSCLWRRAHPRAAKLLGAWSEDSYDLGIRAAATFSPVAALATASSALAAADAAVAANVAADVAAPTPTAATAKLAPVSAIHYLGSRQCRRQLLRCVPQRAWHQLVSHVR